MILVHSLLFVGVKKTTLVAPNLWYYDRLLVVNLNKFLLLNSRVGSSSMPPHLSHVTYSTLVFVAWVTMVKSGVVLAWEIMAPCWFQRWSFSSLGCNYPCTVRVLMTPSWWQSYQWPGLQWLHVTGKSWIFVAWVVLTHVGVSGDVIIDWVIVTSGGVLSAGVMWHTCRRQASVVTWPRDCEGLFDRLQHL